MAHCSMEQLLYSLLNSSFHFGDNPMSAIFKLCAPLRIDFLSMEAAVNILGQTVVKYNAMYWPFQENKRGHGPL